MSENQFLEPVERMSREAARVGGGLVPPPIEPPTPRDEDDGMEPRVRRLEDDVRAIRTDLTMINGRLSNVEGKLDMLIVQVTDVTKQGNALATQMSDLSGQMRTLSTHVATKVMGPWQLVGAMLVLCTGIGIGTAAVKLMQWLKIVPA